MENKMLDSQFVQLNQAIKDAGKIIMKYFTKGSFHIEQKLTAADYQTQADCETEEANVKAIEKIFPDYNIWGEEHGKQEKGSEYTFVIDPLDGTNNFVLGMPVFATNVALLKNGEIIYGAIHHPITGRIYYAEKGKGAFENGNPISVNKQNSIEKVTACYYCRYTTPRERIRDFRQKLQSMPLKRELNMWCPGFCYSALASGNIEAIITDDIPLYDYAAGRLIASEAGAKISDFSGNEDIDDENASFLMTNGTAIHDEMLEAIQSVIG